MNRDTGIAASYDPDCTVVQCARIHRVQQFEVTTSVPSQDGPGGRAQSLPEAAVSALCRMLGIQVGVVQER